VTEFPSPEDIRHEGRGKRVRGTGARFLKIDFQALAASKKGRNWARIEIPLSRRGEGSGLDGGLWVL